MSTPKGYSSQEKDDRLSAQFVTVEPVRELQNGLSVLAHQYVYEVDAGSFEAGCTTSVLQASGHPAKVGDVIRFTSGALSGQEVRVYSVTTNTITLAETLAAAPSAGDTGQFLRHKYPTVEPTGEVKVSGVFAEVATSPDGGALPAVLKVVGGYDGAAVQVLKTDAAGELQVDVLSSALPAGAATSAVQTNGSQKTQIVDGSGNVIGSTGNALDVNLKTPITVDVSLSQANDSVAVFGNDGAANRALKTDSNGELQIDVLSSALPAGAATESTLSTLNGKVTACDTGSVVISSSALPSGAATETTLGAVKTSVELIDDAVVSDGAVFAGKGLVIAGVTSGGVAQIIETNASGHVHVADGGGSLTVDATSWPLPTGAATESTLSTLNGKVTACNTGAVTISTALPSGANTIGKVDVNNLSVVDLLDANILDTSSTNINGSASAPTQVVATLAAAVKKMQLLDTTGAFIGVYTGAAASEVLQFVMGPGSDQTIEHSISAGTRISLKRLDSTTAISSGIVALNFIG